MAQQLEIRSIGFLCHCGAELPIPMNPLPFPGLYFCSICNGQFKITLESIELIDDEEE